MIPLHPNPFNKTQTLVEEKYPIVKQKKVINNPEKQKEQACSKYYIVKICSAIWSYSSITEHQHTKLLDPTGFLTIVGSFEQKSPPKLTLNSTNRKRREVKILTVQNASTMFLEYELTERDGRRNGAGEEVARRIHPAPSAPSLYFQTLLPLFNNTSTDL